jgi:uncharacterized protein (TIGR03435 family)
MRAQGLTIPRITNDPGRFQAYSSLANLIQRAYRLQYFEKVLGPDGLTDTYLTIQAKIPDGVSTDKVPDMLRALLVDRLKLQVHRDPRDEPVYLLTVGKDGPKLKPAAANAGPGSGWKPQGSPIVRTNFANEVTIYTRLNGVTMLESDKIEFPTLVRMISNQAHLPVIDKTGITGFYEVVLPVPGTDLTAALSRGAADAAGQAPDPEGVDLVKSVEKLGLKMEKAKAPISRLTVDHVEKAPSEN